MTSEFLELTPVPIAPAASKTITCIPAAPSDRAVASPSTPAPMTTQSTSSIYAQLSDFAVIFMRAAQCDTLDTEITIHVASLWVE
jgi:hypothetical protein